MYEKLGNMNQSAHYSDVAEAGGLAQAIDAQLKAIGSRLRVKKADDELPSLFPFDWEVVQENHRFCQVNLAADRRLFMSDFWDRGVCLAHGSTSSLREIAEAIDVWIAQQRQMRKLQREFPFVRFEPKAVAHELGAAAEVDRAWQNLYERSRLDGYRDLAPLIDEAMQVPALRQLFPFTSLSALCLSRCTGYPFSGDCPSACATSRGVIQGLLTPEHRDLLPPMKAYTVADSTGRRLLGHGDAAEAVELMVRHLPPNCGPAVQGTADDLT